MQTWRDPICSFRPRSRPWYKLGASLPMTSEGEFSDPYIFFSSNVLGLTFVKPLYSESGVFLGVAAADVNMNNVATYVSNYFDKHYGEWFIMDQNQYLVASSTIPATTTNA